MTLQIQGNAIRRRWKGTGQPTGEEGWEITTTGIIFDPPGTQQRCKQKRPSNFLAFSFFPQAGRASSTSQRKQPQANVTSEQVSDTRHVKDSLEGKSGLGLPFGASPGAGQEEVRG